MNIGFRFVGNKIDIINEIINDINDNYDLLSDDNIRCELNHKLHDDITYGYGYIGCDDTYIIYDNNDNFICDLSCIYYDNNDYCDVIIESITNDFYDNMQCNCSGYCDESSCMFWNESMLKI